MSVEQSNLIDPSVALTTWASVSAGSAPVRERILHRLRRESFDLLVIGGGITGAGVALDAALRGLRVALVEKGDFASGTSSASSKLIHGGLRYLEQGAFGLVREALRERHVLLKLAPHLVRPLRILVPHYAGATRPRWVVKLGLAMYDWLAGRERIGRHRTLSAVEMAHAAAGLRTQGLLGGFEFFDAQMDDARLCLEVVLTAQASGVAAINYVEAVGLTRQNGSVNGCQLLEQLTGDHIRVTARSVVNAAGPWLDLVCRMDDQTAPVQLAASKGVHIILPHMELPAGLLVTHPADGRVMFVLPWMNRTLVGTTDTFTQEMPDNITASPADTDYLLVAVNHYFGKSLSRRDVINTIAGLRPLLRQNVQQPSAASREFSVVRSASGLWSIAGGKYTTYRSMAEQLTDRIVADLGGSLSGLPSRTASHRLVGAPSQDWCEFRERERSEMIEKYRLEPPVIDHLIDRYGTRARCVVEECDESVAWERVVAREPDVWAEFHYQSRHEMAVRSADHLLRRTRLGLFWPESFVAELTPPQLDWNRAGGVPQSTEAS